MYTSQSVHDTINQMEVEPKQNNGIHTRHCSNFEEIWFVGVHGQFSADWDISKQV